MVEKVFSKAWKSSKDSKKQRKYAYNAPVHIKRKFLGAGLSKELKGKYQIRTLPLRKGDKVKIMRGQFRGHIGKIERSDLTKCRIFITGAEMTKRDGTKSLYPIHASNVTVIELDVSDKKRKKSLDRKKNKGVVKPVAKSAKTDHKSEKKVESVDKKETEVKDKN